MTPTASIFSASLASGLNRMTAAWASTKARLMVGLVSFWIAATSAGNALGSFDLNTARAASSRRAGSGDNSVRPPSAASMARRTRLLTRTGLRSPGAFAAGFPVAASRTAPARSRKNTFFSCSLKSSRPSCKASMIAMASGLPVWATAPIAESVSAKLSVVKPTRAFSRSCAWAADMPSSATHSTSASDRKPLRRKRIIKPPAWRGRHGVPPAIASAEQLAAAPLGDGVVVPAFQLDPVRRQVARAFKMLRPGRAGNQIRRFPHHVELAVATHLTDEHRLGDVVVGQHGRGAAGEVGRGDARQRVDNGVGIDRFHLGDGVDVHLEADHMRFHRVVGNPFRIFREGLPLLDEFGIAR